MLTERQIEQIKLDLDNFPDSMILTMYTNPRKEVPVLFPDITPDAIDEATCTQIRQAIVIGLLADRANLSSKLEQALKLSEEKARLLQQQIDLLTRAPSSSASSPTRHQTWTEARPISSSTAAFSATPSDVMLMPNTPHPSYADLRASSYTTLSASIGARKVQDQDLLRQLRAKLFTINKSYVMQMLSNPDLLADEAEPVFFRTIMLVKNNPAKSEPEIHESKFHGQTIRNRVKVVDRSQLFHMENFTELKDMEGVVFVFDVTDRERFSDAKSYFADFEKHSPNIMKILARRFSTIQKGLSTWDTNREVSESEAKALAETVGATYVETSAKREESQRLYANPHDRFSTLENNEALDELGTIICIQFLAQKAGFLTESNEVNRLLDQARAVLEIINNMESPKLMNEAFMMLQSQLTEKTKKELKGILTEIRKTALIKLKKELPEERMSQVESISQLKILGLELYKHPEKKGVASLFITHDCRPMEELIEELKRIDLPHASSNLPTPK